MADHHAVVSRCYCCFRCQNPVARRDDIVSKSFQVIKAANNLPLQAQTGRAVLFSHAMNLFSGPKEDRHLITGLHTVADVYCKTCGEGLGWKYLKAYEEEQKYKEGKVVLEIYKIVQADDNNNNRYYFHSRSMG